MSLSKPEIMLSAQQEEAIRTVCQHFGFCRKHVAKRQHYVLLLAMMQCGKTKTFHKIIRYALKYGGIKRVYIICGSDAKALYRQAEGDTISLNGWAASGLASHWAGRWNSTTNSPNITEDPCSWKSVCHNDTIQVIFRQNLKKATLDMNDALIILDESHLVQTKNQSIDKFFKRHGLSLAGETECMRERNTHILSVSATPFSEMANIRTYSQDDEDAVISKKIVIMKQPDGHYGVPQYYREKRLRKTAPLTTNEGRAKFIRYTEEKNKYSIVRLNDKDERKALKDICKDKNYKLIEYDGNNKMRSIVDEQLRSTVPKRPTIILLKGMFRCGNVVPKRHIGIVWDGSTNAKFDTILQSLLGRMCGYDFGVDKPYIFIAPNCFEKEKSTGLNQIERYIKIFEDDGYVQGIMPTIATNVVKPRDSVIRTRNLVRMMRFKASSEQHIHHAQYAHLNDTRMSVGSDAISIRDEYAVPITAEAENAYYTEAQLNEMLSALISNETPAFRLVSDRKQRTYMENAIKAYRENVPIYHYTSEGLGTNAAITFIYVAESSKYPEEAGYVYVAFQLESADVDMRIYYQPSTNKKEVFNPEAEAIIERERLKRMKKNENTEMHEKDASLEGHAGGRHQLTEAICTDSTQLLVQFDTLVKIGHKYNTGKYAGKWENEVYAFAHGDSICFSIDEYSTFRTVLRIIYTVLKRYNAELVVMPRFAITGDNIRIKSAIMWRYV